VRALIYHVPCNVLMTTLAPTQYEAFPAAVASSGTYAGTEAGYVEVSVAGAMCSNSHALVG
jgi:hypothetical protein